MRLDEIIIVPDTNKQLFSINDYDLINGKHIGYSENGTIVMMCSNIHAPTLTMYGLFSPDGNTLLVSIIGVKVLYKGKSYFQVKDVFTPEQFRQQGFATALYSALVSKYKIALISDRKQTNAGRQLWTALSKVLDVKVFDSVTRELVPYHDVVNNIYVTDIDDNKNRYHWLMAEQQHNELMFDEDNVGDGILLDRIHYTNPNSYFITESTGVEIEESVVLTCYNTYSTPINEGKFE